jgi:dihydrofolate synthase/folylpolyglutamate synthase
MSGPIPGWQQALFERRTMGIRLGLEVVRAAFDALDRPAGTIPAVHVVGTNGKGSTAAMTAHGLARAGKRVGLYTSPHLHRVGERVRIDGVALTDEALRVEVEAVLAIEAAGALPRALTFFEILTLAAMRAFAAAKVEVIVLEAGLGGRLDATRIGSFVVTLITSISRDHMALLGSTLAAIAGEKAAVMEHGAPTFSVQQVPEVEAVLRATALKFGASLTFVEALAAAPAGLVGAHQRWNGALALAALRRLVPGAEATLLDGVRWPGRLERARIGGGEVVFDVGHNVDGIAALAGHLRGIAAPRGGRLIVFGCMSDKEGPAMVALLAGLGARLWVVSPGDHEGWSPAALAAGVVGVEPRGRADDPSLLAELSAALAAGVEVVICGSHYLVGGLRAALLGEASDRVSLSDPLPRG